MLHDRVWVRVSLFPKCICFGKAVCPCRVSPVGELATPLPSQAISDELYCVSWYFVRKLC